jgi:hypothetical protein
MIALHRAVGVTGFVVGGAGAAVDEPLIVWLAIGLLSAAIALRGIARVRRRRTLSDADSVSASEDG